MHISSKGRYVRIHRRRVGGSVPVLLSKVETKAEYGGELSSNKIVGIITPKPMQAAIEGGKLLSHIHFGSAHKKHNQNDRIKFIF